MKHFIGVAIVVAILTVLVGFGLNGLGLLPEQASMQAVPIDNLFHLHIWAISFLFALIIGFILYSVIVFRRKPGEEGEGAHFEGNTPLEIVWTIIPLGIVLFFAFLGSTALAETRRADPRALEVTVVGQQWAWRFDYPEYGFSSTELVLPVNKQALLTMTSTDVIHSFWVPEFRVKQDALPGKGFERELRVTPTEIGDFNVRCAELCGLQHAYMVSDVRVVSQSEFEAWVQEKSTALPDDPVARGQEWAQQFGCVACHSVDGSALVGPSWFGIYGEQADLADGTSVSVDEAYLFASIRNPQAQIVAGFENILMPPTGESMTDEQINDVIEYIKSLSEN